MEIIRDLKSGKVLGEDGWFYKFYYSFLKNYNNLLVSEII